MIKRGDFHVYIIECSRGTYYTGYTKDLGNRLRLHSSGRGAKYLKGKAPIRLVYAKKYRNWKNAILEELRIKRLPRKKKEELVRSYRAKEPVQEGR
jgi:putative endonuclease